MAATNPTTPAVGTVRYLLRDPNYVCIWAVGGLTGVVRWLQLLVMGVYTFEITGSPLLVALVPVMWMTPLTVLGPVIGVVADRVNRKLLYAVAQGSVVVLSISMAVVAYVDSLQFVHIAIASVLSGVFWTTDMPVRRRMMGDLAGDSLSTAMSLDSATGNATRMAGPLLGGVLLQTVSMVGVFALSAVLFSVCLGLVIVARIPQRKQMTATPAFIRDLAAGVRYVAGNRSLRRIFGITIVFNIWGFPFTSMIPVLGKERLDLDPLMVGFLSSMEGLGAFIGAMMVAVFAERRYFFDIYLGGTTVYLCLIGYLSVLSFTAGGPNHSFVIVSVALVFIGICSACFAAMQSTLSYMGAPPEYRSRVLGVLTLCIGTGPIGFINVGLMAEAYGVSKALLIISLEGLAVLIFLAAYGSSARPPIQDDPEPASDTASATEGD